MFILNYTNVSVTEEYEIRSRENREKADVNKEIVTFLVLIKVKVNKVEVRSFDSEAPNGNLTLFRLCFVIHYLICKSKRYTVVSLLI